MFAKLLKNEFIQTGRMYLVLLAVGVGAGGLGALFTMKQNVGMGQFIGAIVWNFLLILFAAILETLGIVITLVSTNRSLFTERGYLTFSLPVSSTQLLLSKFTANVAFMLLTIAEAVGLIYVALFVNLRNLAGNIGDTLIGKMGAGAEDFRDQFSAEALGLPTRAELLRFGAFALMWLIMFLILAMMAVLFVLTISHVRPFQSSPGLWIFVFLLASLVFCVLVVKNIGDAIQIIMPLQFRGLSSSVLGSTGDTGLNMMHAIVMLGLSVMFFFLTNFLMKRKISLK